MRRDTLAEAGMDGELSANERAFADHVLSKRPILRDVKMRLGARYDVQVHGSVIEGSTLLPLYSYEGDLLYVLDFDTGEKFTPVTAEDIKMSKMSDGELAHYLADKKLGHKRGQVNKVYFIGGEGTAIKIGTTVDVSGRLRSIQACSPVKLAVLAWRYGDAQREAAYHTQFREHRLHGEWFSPHPDILAEIERLSNAC